MPARGWQVLWPSVNITDAGELITRYRDEVLPDTTDADELDQRAKLVISGALRLVQVAATDEDLTAAASTAAAATLAQDLAEHAAETGQAEPESADPQPPLTIATGTIIDATD